MIHRRTFIKSVTAGTAFIGLSETPAAWLSFPDDHIRCDLAVIGATPGGIACAIRAAREGMKVVLTSHTMHLGGMITNGLSAWDTFYSGFRSPIYNELRQNIFDYYKNKYGEDSEQYLNCTPFYKNHQNGRFEAHVAEKMVNEMINKESNIKVLLGYYPLSSTRKSRILDKLTMKELNGKRQITIKSTFYADCTYEADLAAVAGVKYRVGREARAEFNEPHAGRIFMRPNHRRTPSRMDHIQMNLNYIHYGHNQEIIFPESTGEGDGNVQAYNFRMVLTNDPANRIILPKPENYNREFAKELEYQSILSPIPNKKLGWNRPQVIGIQTEYVEGNWEIRKKVTDRHLDAAFQKMYYLQNDPEVPEHIRNQWKEIGLPKDEFTDNKNVPYEMYVREARRIVGKYICTEHDYVLSKDYDRAPVHHDSIATTDWYMDAHAATTEKLKDSLQEGKMMPHVESVPGHIPLRSVLTNEYDNLIVPVCISSTHVAWGAIRLEPTWMNICESAAHAVVIASKNNSSLDKINTDVLQRQLAENKNLICFMNDIDADNPFFAPVQYFGTKGFFNSYNSKWDKQADHKVVRLWIEAAKDIKNNNLDAAKLAQTLQMEFPEGVSVTMLQFIEMLEKTGLKTNTGSNLTATYGLKNHQMITVGMCCRILYDLTK